MRFSNSRILCLMVLLALLLGFSGCSRQGRYQVLTFFFTGVPPLDAPPESSPGVAAAEDEVDPALARREQILAERARAEARKPYTGAYAHGPYAAKECGQCHEMAKGSFGFGNLASQTQMNIVPARFVLPRAELCVACHTNKSPAAAAAAGLRLHGPAWLCTSCHSPHNGQEPFFLKVAVDQLCQQCHGEGFIHARELHDGLSACLDCHNPHLGRDTAMLRDTYQETF